MRKSKGFSLLETLVAVGIMATALMLLSQSWGSAFFRVRRAQQIFEIASLMERKMTEVELDYRGKSLEEIPEEKSDNFGESFPQYSWKMTSKKLELPDLTSMVIAQQKDGADQFLLSLIKQLSEGISKSVKEVTVTVTYQPGGKEKAIENKVTTYFVDYNKPLQVGMPGG